jgi:hypothetical protein
MGSLSFPGIKRLQRGVNHPPPSSAEVKERVELYIYCLIGPSWPVRYRKKLALYQNTKAQWGSRFKLYSFFNHGTIWGGWSTPRPGRFAPGKDPVSFV